MTAGAARRVAATVGAVEAGRRLDLWLAARLPDLSRTRIKALVDAGRVRVDGAASKAAHRLKDGERVEVVVPPPAPESVPGLPHLTGRTADGSDGPRSAPAGRSRPPGW